MEKKFDELLGKLSLKEKLAQKIVFGMAGVMPDPWLLDFTKKYGWAACAFPPTEAAKPSVIFPPGSCTI